MANRDLMKRTVPRPPWPGESVKPAGPRRAAGAAFLHAAWNTLVRRDPDRIAASAAIAGGGVIVGAVLLALLPGFAPVALIYVAVSSVIHVAYFALIGRAYHHGELSLSYPLMRGLAPLIVTFAAAFVAETPPTVVVIGVAVVTLGIVSLGVEGFRRGRCRGLSYAHQQGFIHCDIKPQNLLITNEKVLKITDFGISRALDTISREEQVDTVWGSPYYISPEQASGKAPSPATDLYSLGVVAYEMFSGCLPFTADDATELARKHRNGETAALEQGKS